MESCTETCAYEGLTDPSASTTHAVAHSASRRTNHSCRTRCTSPLNYPSILYKPYPSRSHDGGMDQGSAPNCHRNSNICSIVTACLADQYDTNNPMQNKHMWRAECVPYIDLRVVFRWEGIRGGLLLASRSVSVRGYQPVLLLASDASDERYIARTIIDGSRSCTLPPRSECRR